MSRSFGSSAAKSLTFRDFGLEENPFPELSAPVSFGGVGSSDPLSFAYYNPAARLSSGKTLAETLPISAALWHFKNGLKDIFSDQGTAIHPWSGATPLQEAQLALRSFYYFMHLMGIRYWCFHDLDLCPFGSSMPEFRDNLEQMLPLVAELTALSGIRVGWTTQALFVHPLYTGGAATNPDFGVFAAAWSQTKQMLDFAKRLQDCGCGAGHHVFWGGREGYRQLTSILLGRERRQLAAFLRMCANYAGEIGLAAQMLIEPKWCEPSTHQYDSSAAVVLGFLREYGLIDHFKLNLEVNHAQLAQLTIGHEVAIALDAGALGGIDVNEGTFGNGWDTDRFLGDPLIAFDLMYPILASKTGLNGGVYNFDAHRDRESFAPIDLFHAHILGMDALALGTAMADAALADGRIAKLVERRYESFQHPLAAQVLEMSAGEGRVDFGEVARFGDQRGMTLRREQSAHHEMIRSLVLRTMPAALALLS